MIFSCVIEVFSVYSVQYRHMNVIGITSFQQAETIVLVVICIVLTLRGPREVLYKHITKRL